MPKPIALITGVTGQDGSYLAEFLLDRGYKVYGMERRHSTQHHDNIKHIIDNPDFETVFGDMTDAVSLSAILKQCRPEEVYNLAAQSFVHLSWTQPYLTNQVNYLGFINLLEACRSLPRRVRIYQASSSEMFGNQPPLQNEETRMTPRSPYGVSKLASHRIAQVYRESFDMFIACGICYNHESPRRGIEFVTRKIVRSVADIVAGKADKLALGTLDSRRDWGYAPDFVRAMWLMLQQDAPDDFVIATGRSHSVEDFCRAAFELVDLDFTDHVVTDEKFVRPAEVWSLQADVSKAKELLGWEATTKFHDLVEIMVKAELEKC